MDIIKEIIHVQIFFLLFLVHKVLANTKQWYLSGITLSGAISEVRTLYHLFAFVLITLALMV